jgi:hypothetical protein
MILKFSKLKFSSDGTSRKKFFGEFQENISFERYQILNDAGRFVISEMVTLLLSIHKVDTFDLPIQSYCVAIKVNK